MKKKILRYFPVPEFLKMPSVGLDISDGSVRYVELVETERGRELNNYGNVDLAPGIVKNGEVHDREKLVEILKNLKKNFESEFVRVSVLENNSYIFRTKVAKTEDMSLDEMRAALRFKLEENVPLKPEEVIFDFDIVGMSDSKFDIVVSALPRHFIQKFTEVFDEAGLIPLSFEVEAQAVARSVVGSDDKETYMVVDFRNTRASISVVSDGVAQFTSALDMGGDDLVYAVEKHLNISKDKAKDLKNEKGFVKTNSEDDLFFAMMNTISALKDEINQYIIYWHSLKENSNDGRSGKTIKKIILCGANGGLRGLDEYLSLSLGIKVEKANVWKNILSLDEVVPDMSFSDSLEYATAIGLAMRNDGGMFFPQKRIKYV